HAGGAFAMLHLLDELGLDPPSLRLPLEQRQVLPPTEHGARFVAGEIGGYAEQPRPWVVGVVLDRAHEGLLRQILGALYIPHPAVEVADQLLVAAAIDGRPVYAHARDLLMDPRNARPAPMSACGRGRTQPRPPLPDSYLSGSGPRWGKRRRGFRARSSPFVLCDDREARVCTPLPPPFVILSATARGIACGINSCTPSSAGARSQGDGAR